MVNRTIRLSYWLPTKQGCLAMRMALAGLLVALLTGCQTRQLVPTPNLFLNTSIDPFEEVPEVYRNNEVDVLYLTDRKQKGQRENYVEYGVERSLSVAWGSAIVRMGQDIDWPTLSAASLERKRSIALPVSVDEVHESGRFPSTPAPVVQVDGGWQVEENYARELAETQQAFLDDLRKRLARTQTKEAYILVHGYHNVFEDTAMMIAEFWHFMGRQGVPIHYTWPAGKSGALRGYNYDRESSEFTVYHLKEAIRLLASCEELEGIHLIGHSRGTDVVSSAMRELMIETRAMGKDTAARFKIRNVILAAPDLDMDVISQRLMAEHIVGCADQVTIYVSESDKAIGAASGLFGSTRRLGQLRSDDFSEKEKQMLPNPERLSFVDAAISADLLNHGYFHNDPAVSSDVILVLKYGDAPGRENGRPLEPLEGNFWRITDNYPVYESKPEQ